MDQSRWFIKDKPLLEQIKACKKSLESARRGGRQNIVRALEEKLSKLEGLEGKAKKVKKVRKKVKKGKVEVSQQAVDLLLRATAKAKAEREAAGEESEEEAAVPEIARSGEAEVEDDFFDVPQSEASRVVEVQKSSFGSRGAGALAYRPKGS